jgi:ADP-ribosylglycohydrolase
MTEADIRLKRAYCALEGLSVGDALGGMYFVEGAEEMVENRLLFAPLWDYTDDTLMSLSIYSELRQRGCIEQSPLALSFAHRYDDTRGYGPAMHRLLESIRMGIPWSTVSPAQFEGQGSHGNGAAMRAVPIGGFFADDLPACITEAIRASEVTHAHPEGIAGGIAIAIAAALAYQAAQRNERPDRSAFLDSILPYVPEGIVHAKIQQARDLPPNCSRQLASAVLGTGLNLSAQDTVPFALWCAGEQLDNYEEALWLTLSGFGDRDTTCAIVGGIVALYTGVEAIPAAWRKAREPLPAWPFEEKTE